MPALPQTGDLTKQYLSLERQIVGFRPNPGASYPIGSCVKLLSRDQQNYPDAKTVGPPVLTAAQQLIMGVVSDTWPGFDGNGATVAPSSLARGTSEVQVVTIGYHPAALVDQSGTGATSITNETPLVPSRATAGYMQGIAAGVGGLGTAAVAFLPASGVCSTLTAAALAQATLTDTIAGTPAIGDVLSITLQIPYTLASPGVAQTYTLSHTLIAGEQTTVTTAALALLTAINLDPILKLYYIASQSSGVVTITTVQGAAWLVTFGTSALGLTDQFSFTWGGSAANGATMTVAATGGSTATASAGTFSNGTGYKGSIPAFVV